MPMVDKRIRIILDSSGAKKNADDLNRSIVGVGKSADNSVFSMNRLAGAIAAVISVQKLKQYSDAWTSINNQLRQTVQTQEGLVAITDRLLQVSNESRQSVEATASLYTRFRLSVDESTISSERLVGVIETINKSLAIGGATAQESAGALRQLSQAIASGVLRGEEFNSIAEQAPEILRAVSAATGKTAGELRALAADGAITSQVLIDSLEAYATTVDQKFAASTPTISQAFEVLKNNTIAFVGQANEAIGASEGFARSMINLGNVIGSAEFLAGFLETLQIAKLTFDSIAESTAQFSNEIELLGDIGSESLGFIGRAFKELPANVKAAIQVITTEFLSLVEKSRATRNALVDMLSAPFTDQTVGGAYEKYLQDLQRIDQVRQDSLQTIFDEKEAILATADAASKARIKEIEERRRARLEAPTAVNASPTVTLGGGTTLSDKDIGKRDSAYQDEIRGAQSVTAALRMELETRRKISDAYIEASKVSASEPFEYERALLLAREQEERAIAAQRNAEQIARREEQMRQAIEHENLTEQQILDIKKAYAEQEKLQKQIHQEEMTAIDREYAEERIRIAEIERAAKQQLTFDLASSGIALLQAFGSKSEKMQKRYARLSIIADTAQGIAKGVALGWPAGIPAIAWATANGKMAMDRLNSGGSSGAGVSASGGGAAPSDMGGLPTTNSNQPQFEQKRVIEVRGVSPDSLITGQQLADILSSDDNVIVQLNNAQQDAQRRGVIT